MVLENTTAIIDDTEETFSSVLVGNRELSSLLGSVLRRASEESRLTVGLHSAIRRLSVAGEEALFCLMAPSRRRDSADHMQRVLLEAFCLENYIYIVEVDSAARLRRSIGIRGVGECDCDCVLIHTPSPRSDLRHLSPQERLLAEHCENNWGVASAPLIKLPEE